MQVFDNFKIIKCVRFRLESLQSVNLQQPIHICLSDLLVSVGRDADWALSSSSFVI